MDINVIGANSFNMVSASAKAAPDAKGARPDIAPSVDAQDASGKSGQAQPQQAMKAVFAVNADNKVVIQILDSSGKVLMQVPPEQSAMLKNELQALMKNLFSKEA